jgi:uncharacterized protein (DUF362 family)/Pyruvate/2-oxoacid:ferredoxin oxidoreductase delta subunit
MSERVYAIKCPDYSSADQKIKELIDMMGGISRFVKPGEKIALKANLLQGSLPETAVTTHPDVLIAAGKLVKSAGGEPVIVDSPGGGYQYNVRNLEKIYRECGIYESAYKFNIKLNFDTGYKTVFFSEGKLVKRFEVINPVLEADTVFNMCKLKTHVLMHMTGAVKNNFGVIPGLTKPGYHAKLDNKMYFAGMLLDLAEFVSPGLSIMDAVIGLEGRGPGSSGVPRKVGWLLASENQLALDIVAGEMMGIKFKNNPVLQEAANRKMYPVCIDDIEIEGASIEELLVKDYLKPESYSEDTKFTDFAPFHNIVAFLLKKGASLKPVIIGEKCIKCGVCIKACPVNAIKYYKNKYAKINKKICIRCYCCHEMCRSSAVELKKSILYKVFNRADINN